MKKVLILFLILATYGCDDNQVEDDILKKLDLPDDVSFTHLPTDLNFMNTFGAIGQVFGIPKGHGGFTLKTITFTDPSIPV